MQAVRRGTGGLPSLLDAKALGFPVRPPHRGRQSVLLTRVRVQRESRWKRLQPWRARRFRGYLSLCLHVMLERVKYAWIDGVGRHRSNA